MKIRDGFVKREVAGKIVVVPTGEAGKTVAGMIKLNKTAEVIWDGASEGLTEEEIAKKLVEMYSISDEVALTDTKKIVA